MVDIQSSKLQIYLLWISVCKYEVDEEPKAAYNTMNTTMKM